MIKLKTLKDIESKLTLGRSRYKSKTLNDFFTAEFSKEVVTKTDLRKEAIKQIKSCNTGGFTFSFGFDGKVTQWHKKKEKLLTIDYVNLGEMIGLINFFNIINDDLK